MKMQANTTLFFYQNGKLTTVSEKGRPRTIFRAEDTPLAEQHASDATAPGLLATDDKGSVLTVRSNEEEEDHAYSAYGHDPSLRSGNRLLGFNGEQIESSIEHYLLGNGYRVYDPRQLRRFLSPDSLSPFEAGGLNAYAYCENDPINNIDPFGRNLIKASSLMKGIKNKFFSRKQNKIDRINLHNKQIKETNKTLTSLEPNEFRGKTDIYSVYRNQIKLEKLKTQYQGSLSEKDTNYANKHEIPVTTINKQGEKFAEKTEELVIINYFALEELKKIHLQDLQKTATYIRETEPGNSKYSTTQHSFLGGDHANGRFN